jgi:hypothetical protein
MTLTIRATLDAIHFSGLEVTRGMPLDYYERALGTPNRWVMPGPPPPYGHRNNILHFYDDFGFFLREHHSSRLIEGVDFLLDPSKSHFPTISPFTGELMVCGVGVFARMDFSDFARQCDVSFKPHLGHAWYADGEKISIQFEIEIEKCKGRSKRELISEVAIGFRGAHFSPTV